MNTRKHQAEHDNQRFNRALSWGLLIGVIYGAALGSVAEQERARKRDATLRTAHRLAQLERRAFLEEHPEFAMPGEQVPRNVADLFAPKEGPHP